MYNSVPKIKDAKPLTDYKLFVEFNDGIMELLICQNGKVNQYFLIGIMKKTL